MYPVTVHKVFKLHENFHNPIQTLPFAEKASKVKRNK